LRTADFESAASTNSATRAFGVAILRNGLLLSKIPHNYFPFTAQLFTAALFKPKKPLNEGPKSFMIDCFLFHLRFTKIAYHFCLIDQ